MGRAAVTELLRMRPAAPGVHWQPNPAKNSPTGGAAVAIKTLFTAHAVNTGGRNGHTQADDGLISLDLSIPKSMGGPGRPNTSTPEHLFAAGYAACFGSACEFVSRQMKIIPKGGITVKTAVSIGEAPGGG